MEGHLIPFVAIGGVGNGYKKEGSYEFKANDDPLLEQLVAQLRKRASTSGPWLPGDQKLDLRVANSLDLPQKTIPSQLSPKNPTSVLYPKGIFTDLWVKKYTQQIPTTVILCVDLEDSDDAIERQIENLRSALRAARSHIFVIALGGDQTRLNGLRRTTGLAPRTGLVGIDSSVDLSVFVGQMWALLQAQAADFFAARSRETRHKRAQHEQSELWEARYTLKLAYFAEFKADYDGAIRLYQSAYDCLAVLGDEPLQTICTHKIYLFLLYYQRYTQAYAKFRFHLASCKDADWQAQQLLNFADCLSLSVVENWALAPEAPSASRALPRPGFIYLSAAKIAASAALKHKAFKAAINDFKQLPRCRAAACIAYGDFLAPLGDAVEYYEQALKTLDSHSQLFLPISRKIREISESPLADFYLWSLDSKELPSDADLGAIELPLFKVQGIFDAESAFVGKPLKCQLCLVPQFKGKLELNTIKVQFTSTSMILDSDLVFDSAARFFDFDIKPAQVGECEFMEVQIDSLHPKFSQRLPVEPTPLFRTTQTTKHRWVIARRFIEVHARPQKLALETAQIPPVLCAQETTQLSFNILNNEPEVAAVHADVVLRELDTESETELTEFDEEIAAGASTTFSFSLTSPAKAFVLEFRTTYTTPNNMVPVSHCATAEVEVIKPFQTNYSLNAELHTEEWPNIFVPSDQCEPLPLIRRRWVLGAKVMNMCDQPLRIVRRRFNCDSSQASIVSLHSQSELDVTLAYNESTRTELHFEAMRKDRDLRSFEAEGELVLEWHRAATPDQISEFKVPKVRLSLPNQEPRVLLTVDSKTEAGALRLEYYLENATSHVLNFAVSMGSSQYFSVNGIKATNLKLMPFSRHALTYSLYPTCSPADKPLPELRVFDTTYKKVLGVVADSENIYADGAHLKVKPNTINPIL